MKESSNYYKPIIATFIGLIFFYILGYLSNPIMDTLFELNYNLFQVNTDMFRTKSEADVPYYIQIPWLGFCLLWCFLASVIGVIFTKTNKIKVGAIIGGLSSLKYAGAALFAVGMGTVSLLLPILAYYLGKRAIKPALIIKSKLSKD